MARAKKMSSRTVFKHHLANIYRLGVKELWSLWRDPFMLVLIIYSFSFGIYIAATAMPDTLHTAAIAIVDEDDSTLSARIATAFYKPTFNPPVKITHQQIDPDMDAGKYTFVLVIPAHYQRDLLDGKNPQLQLNIDATRMSQAFIGDGVIQQIVMGEVSEFMQRFREQVTPPVDLEVRMRFNPALAPTWFNGLMELISNITMLSIILTGAALIREREHGTVEHLLVMPVSPTEIMLAKIWAMGLIVLVACSFSLTFMLKGVLRVQIEGSLLLFLVGTLLHLFATTAMGMFLATLTKSMPQFALLLILTLLPMELLSGGMTPRESMPMIVQNIMSFTPTLHYTEMSKAILFRGAGFSIVYPQFIYMTLIGAGLFYFSRAHFRQALWKMA